MKHIQRRFFRELKPNQVSAMFSKKNPDVVELENNPDKAKILSNRKPGEIVYTQTDTGLAYGGYLEKIEGKLMIFPIPDPTLIYFNNAQLTLARIKKTKKDLIKILEPTGMTPPIHEMYDFFGQTSSFVIFLFTCLESFINSLIPDDFNYVDKRKNRTEIYDKEQIQKHVDFETKIKKVVRAFTGDVYLTKQSPNVQAIWTLKDFRDQIIHTKQEKYHHLRYKDLMKKSLNFKYEKTLDSIAKVINHFKPDYIVECKCGKDF